MWQRTEKEIAEFPPPYRQLTSWMGVEGLFLGAALLAAVSLVYSVLQENREVLGLSWIVKNKLDLWSIHLLGTSVSASLLGAFLSMFFLRRQFLHAAIPLLDYRNYITTESTAGFSCGGTEKRIYVVELTNVGRGTGIITAARYWVELARGNERPQPATFMEWFRQRSNRYGSSRRYRYTYQTMEQILEQGAIENQQHFDAMHFGAWTAFAPNETRIIFQICLAKAVSIVALDIEITYQSVVGDQYRREIFAIPRRQLTTSADAGRLAAT